MPRRLPIITVDGTPVMVLDEPPIVRLDVFIDIWDFDILPTLKNISAKTMGGITPCIQGVARQGQTRHHVYYPLFDEIKEKLKKT